MRTTLAMVLLALVGTTARAAEDGPDSGEPYETPLACVIDATGSITLVQASGLQTLGADGMPKTSLWTDLQDWWRLVAVGMTESIEDRDAVPAACAAADAIYRSDEEGVTLFFDDEETAAVLSGDAYDSSFLVETGELTAHEQLTYVPMDDPAAPDDRAGHIGAYNWRAASLVGPIDAEVVFSISKPHY